MRRNQPSQWLTGKVIDYWVDNDRYAHLAAVQSEQQIPEYRITEDVRIATDAPIDFALGLVSSLLTAIIFIQVLWTVGGDLSSHWVYRVWVPGYLVISVALYSGVVTIAMISGASGKPAPGSIANQPGHRDHRRRGALDQRGQALQRGFRKHGRAFLDMRRPVRRQRQVKTSAAQMRTGAWMMVRQSYIGLLSALTLGVEAGQLTGRSDLAAQDANGRLMQVNTASTSAGIFSILPAEKRT